MMEYMLSLFSSKKLTPMAKKKSAPANSTNDESILNQLATKAGTVVGEIIVAKNKVTEKVGNAVDTVKAKVQNLTGSKKPTAKKVAKAVVKKAAKKVAPVKKAAKKAAKKVVKKAAKKVATAKKTAKKAAKSTVKKAARRR